jgi:hypothetical protein
MGRTGTLHVTNGESAASTLRQTRLGDMVLAWEDVLTEGPVPRVPTAELREVRASFLRDAGWGVAAAIRARLERRDNTLTEALGRRHVVLWFEHDLFDQLQLLQLLARQLLEPLADGARQASELFVASQEMEEAPYDGDAWVWARLAALGAGDRPLVATMAGDVVPPPPPRGDARRFAATTFAVTDDGRAVLDGSADRVELLGLDRWLGGTHLRADNDWRWDVDRGTVLAP